MRGICQARRFAGGRRRWGPFWRPGLALALAACGDLSLVDTLHQEAPGELRFSPADPVIAVGADLTISVMGGITPYSILTGAVTPVGRAHLGFSGDLYRELSGPGQRRGRQDGANRS